MKNYLFITNSRRPSKEVYESKDPIILKNDSIAYIEAALKLGFEIHMGINRKYASEIICNEYNIKFYNAEIYSNIFDFVTNIRAYRNLNKYIKTNKIEVIHCNSPIGGVLGRVCGYLNNVSKVLYTVHGFHFYKGAPFLYNLIFKNVEKFLAKLTDVIITINEEDYAAALKFRLKNKGNLYKINGVGIDVFDNGINISELNSIYKELGIQKSHYIITSIGDLNNNKNFETIIKAIGELKDKNIHLLICGIGSKINCLKKISESLEISSKIHFLGYRNDILKILMISDLFVLASYREGLPRSIMEAMSIGLPCIVSDIRGNKDLICNEINGFLFKPNNYLELSRKIQFAKINPDILKGMGYNNLIKIKVFSIDIIKEKIFELYERELLNYENIAFIK